LAKTILEGRRETAQMKPKISVVIPAYNSERFLEETLKHVIHQTLEPYEVIIVNDCSTDNTRKIAEKLTSRVNAKIINHQGNLGIGASRRDGSLESSGDYISFCSSDDVWNLFFLEESSKHLDENTATFTDYYYIPEDSLIPVGKFLAPKYKSQEEFRRLVIEWALRKNMFVNFSSVIIPKQIFEKTNFEPELRHGEDLIFLLDTVIHGLNWHHIESPYLYYRLHQKMGTELIKTNKIEFLQLWSYIRDRLTKLGVDQEIIGQSFKKSYRRTFGLASRLWRRTPKLIRAPVKKVMKTLCLYER